MLNREMMRTWWVKRRNKTKRSLSGDKMHRDPYCGWDAESSGRAQLQHQWVWGTCCIHRLQCCAASDPGASRMDTSRVWGCLWFSGLMIEYLCWEMIGCGFSTQTSVDSSNIMLFTCRHFRVTNCVRFNVSPLYIGWNINHELCFVSQYDCQHSGSFNCPFVHVTGCCK